MKKIVLLFLLGLIACDSVEINAQNDVFTDVLAEFNPSGLAYDGCDTHITISNGTNSPTTYIASAATTKVLMDFSIQEQSKSTPNSPNSMASFTRIPVIISFKKTGQDGTLLCGWGKKNTAQTIDIQKISRKN